MSVPGSARNICTRLVQTKVTTAVRPDCQWRVFSTAQCLSERRRPNLRPAVRVLRASPEEGAVESLNGLGTDITPDIKSRRPPKSSQEASIPWYLQMQQPNVRPEVPEHLQERTRLPDLPESSPTLLEPLMQYISTELGMDYLHLLDLRILDPPAALGSNLIMLIGTARGEKHLHVSADRFCRWLRTNYKLRPRADGLLGRNELKIKMRRKSKRLKILAHVGNVDDGYVDDGMKVGWVCVNISGVKPLNSRPTKSQHQGYVGFGEPSDDVTIIVHLMTEEKREEMDLEKLWKSRLKRREMRMAEDGMAWGALSDDARQPGFSDRDLVG